MIIAASGMCEAGRILHHLASTVEDRRAAILIVGYQADHTLGKRLVDRAEEVKILGSSYRRAAEVIVYNSFSAHADGDELLRYIGQFDRNRLRHIFLVHCEFERAADLRSGLHKSGFGPIDIPLRGETFEF